MADRTARCRSLGASEHLAAGGSQPNGWISLSNECHRLMYAKVQLDKKAARLCCCTSRLRKATHTRREVKKRENEPQDTVFMHTRAKKGDDSAGGWQRKVRAKKGNA
jgi:hypothetical protein